jgi:hypothetical protein
MDRYDTFLKKSISEYLENELISEIIITDETGNDVNKIRQDFNNIKLNLFVNSKILGPFLNKLEACKYAKNEWIVLMDSDNFADKNYFIKSKEYIDNVIKYEKNIILSPCKAKPNFNYSHLSGFIYKKGEFNNNKKKEIINNDFGSSEMLMNTGNYVINKYLIDNINLENESENISKSPSCDVIYFNTLLFEHMDLNMHVVDGMEYEHVVHDGSTYLKNCDIHRNFNESVYSRYRNLL